MDAKNLNRRRFLQAAGTLGVAGFIGGGAVVLKNEDRLPTTMYFSAASDASGKHYLAGVDEEGLLRFRVPLNNRGHHLMTHPIRSELIAFARSPGNEAYVIDYQKGQKVFDIHSGNGYHFYGHGIFSQDGKYLFTTENDYKNGKGIISVRETDSYTVVARYSSGGIGPHQLQWLSDKNTIAIANGGLKTHPESGSKILNLSRLDSNLSYMNAQTGEIIEQQRLDNSLLSIRHLDVAADDTVFTGLQYQGGSDDLVPLVAVHNVHNALNMKSILAPDLELLGMNHYTASVALDSLSGIVAVTCPKGDTLTFWNYKNQAFLRSVPFKECAGVVFNAETNQFLVSNNYGEMRYFAVKTLSEERQKRMLVKNTFWDNHMNQAHAPSAKGINRGWRA